MNVLEKEIDKIEIKRVLPFFSKEVIKFIDSLSKRILKDKTLKKFPEIMALGFWLRKSNIEKLKLNYQNELLLPRGVVFHIAPTNVDTIFIYSLILSMLAGNFNILRISDKKNLQLEIILNIFNEELKKIKNIDERVVLIRYGHNDEITGYLSSLCDVRVIWGGDETINHIRKLPIKPTAIELTFADKFSFFAIKKDDIYFSEEFFEKFYRDSFTFSQNACSNIRAICWVDTKKEIKEKFWSEFNKFLEKKKPEIEAKSSIDKFITQTYLSLETDVKNEVLNYCNRVKLNSLNDIKENYHCGYGLFYEIDLKSLNELLLFSSKKHQTLVLYGIDELNLDVIPIGFDRIVSLGKAMEFNNIWDGFDIIKSLSRVVYVDI